MPPGRSIRLPRAQLVDRPQLGAEELERVADGLGGGHEAMLWLGAMLGLRWAEAAGLTVGDVDVLGRTVSVRHQLSREGLLVPPKSHAGRRHLAVPAWLAAMLARTMADRGVTAAEPEKLPFVTGAGTPLSHTNWRSRVWCRLSGCGASTSCGRWPTPRIAGGVNVRTTQVRLGHSWPHVTRALYAGATTEADRRSGRRREALPPARRTRDEEHRTQRNRRPERCEKTVHLQVRGGR